MRRGSILAVLVVCASMLAAATAQAEELVSITSASFSPDVFGAPTNVSGSATIHSTDLPVPSPITHVDVYGPAGVTLNLQGSETCTKALLEQRGAEACPVNSLAGTGGGEGVYELGKELVKEKYTLDFFLADNQPGHVALLVLLAGHSPVAIELVFPAAVVQGPKPYGLGFSLEVPLIKVLPEASDASAESAFVTLGARGHTYLKKVDGKRKRVPIQGIVLPKSCPRGGWPVASSFTFLDGSTVTAKRVVPCPR